MNTIAVLLGYILILFGIAWYVSRNTSIAKYQINDRSSKVWTLALSHFASMVGAGGSVAIVAEVYKTGISFGLALPVSFSIGAIIMATVSEKINKIGEHTQATNITDFFHQRHDEKNATLVGAIQIILLLLWTATQAVAFGSLVTVVTGLNVNLALVVGMLTTVTYSLLGGLEIDLISDVIQTCIIGAVFIAMTVLALQEIPPMMLSDGVPPGHLNPFAYGGVSWFIGVILFSGFIYLGNTSHWQRIISAENPQVARRSYLYAVPILVLFGTIMVYLGLYAVQTLPSTTPDAALFELMQTLLPSEVFAVGLAAVLAIIMSSIDSLLIGGATMVYTRWLSPFFNGNELYHVRITTAGFGVTGFFIAFLFPNIVGLGLSLMYLALTLVPSVFAMLYTRYVTADASFYGIIAGVVTLVSLQPLLGKQVFLASTLVTAVITFGYDIVMF